MSPRRNNSPELSRTRHIARVGPALGLAATGDALTALAVARTAPARSTPLTSERA